MSLDLLDVATLIGVLNKRIDELATKGNQSDIDRLKLLRKKLQCAGKRGGVT